jgi:ABC-type Fe3+-hydroxamate transport system substrate-binding protein
MVFTDAVGRTIDIQAKPKRIISLCPSQTETLIDLGAEKELVGITKYCIHPAEKVRHITKVGGTKNPDIDLIRQLAPDLIIAEKEENKPETIAELEKFCPVYVTNIESIHDVIPMIAVLSRLTQATARVAALINQIQQGIEQLQKIIPTITAKKVMYLIWRKPYMAVSNNTYIHSVITELCGWQNVVSDVTFLANSRYPTITPTMFAELNPDYIFLSSEPYPFKEKHITEIQVLAPYATVRLVDGEMFSWYGSRILKAFKYLHQLIQNTANLD